MKMKITAILIIILLSSIIIISGSEKTNDESYMKDQFGEIEEQIKNRDLLKPDISQVGVAWHLDHLLKVIKNLYHALEISDPKLYKSEVSLKRIAVFVSGTIPRGAGKAPKSVSSPDDIKTEDILKQLEEAKMIIDRYEQLPDKAFFKHPVFGNLNKQQTKRFIEIHTNHHLKIIRDIVE